MSTLTITVINSTTTSPPGSPARGDAYIVGGGATGDWTGYDYQIATYLDGAWEFSGTPGNGWKVYDSATALLMTFDQSFWRIIGTQCSNVAQPDVTVSVTPLQAEVQAINDAVDDLIAALVTSGLMAAP